MNQFLKMNLLVLKITFLGWVSIELRQTCFTKKRSKKKYGYVIPMTRWNEEKYFQNMYINKPSKQN